MKSNKTPCKHEVYIKGLCGNCGIKLDQPCSSSVSMVHSMPELKVTQDYAKEIGKAEQERLIEERKLVLLVDLDQTILHTTHEDIKVRSPEIHSFRLWPGHPTYHTKLRQDLDTFLDSMSKIYEMHIFTFACKRYAHQISDIIDPDHKYFGSRILSRDESKDQFCKHGNINNIFPSGDAMVVIIDDRADVWANAPNLVRVRPYVYFKSSISDGGPVQEDDAEMEAHLKFLDSYMNGSDDESDSEDGDKKNDGPKDEQKNPSQVVLDDDTSDVVVAEIVDKISSSESEEAEPATKNDTSQVIVESDHIDVDVTVDDENRDDDDDDKDDDKDDDNDVDNDDDDDDEDNDEKILKGLDESEESEDDESSTPEVDEKSDYLLNLAILLEKIHEEWFKEVDENRRFLSPHERYKLPETKDIIRRLRPTRQWRILDELEL